MGTRWRISNGASIAATACGRSLFVRQGADFVVVASEPYDDDPAWRAVPEASLVTASLDHGIRVEPLPNGLSQEAS